ncbi:hypothetical protein CNMCM8980_003878 [Aspergillus fumigatiaffinis]|uniref:Anhydro-N-acetylmuramic acid kinase n=1 Tax=Aspergillus fumigatiaffinis TaxID=340414 RepID=A0A8H4EEC3_9EURO|nr:hypothetical protein CNMCM6457_001364 [Aspergillus fumigatiaffinis]KAF4228531.1 hypothetical protein CNMCM6805_001990 [Aspergillus fumigatiaffinis]KAF4234457.1 hypothetical protein CNMCM8980_003878 [Aspergillus fumigatiaffinis]
MRRTPTVRLCGNRCLDSDSMDPLPQSASPEELNLRIEREYNIDGTSRMAPHLTELTPSYAKSAIAEDGHPTRPEFVSALTVDWPKELQPMIMKAFENELSLFDMTRVNYAAGAVRSGSKSLVDRWLKGGYPCGCFVVESGVVAALSKITCVTQFRPVDHALCGSGAPLMQYLDFVAFRHDGPTVALNIGGIANLQLANADRSKMMAFATGPGNVMLDHVVKERTNMEYDKNGELAAKGQVIGSLLAELQSHPFFDRKPPRSAWRLDFGSSYAEDILKRFASSSTEDLLTTLTMFTATSIERALVDFILPKANVTKVVASGGGTRNTTLLKFISQRVATHGLQVCTSDEFGLPAAYKEAIKFATLGFATKRGLANNIPAASGASSFAVLGKLTLAPRLAKNTD